MLVRVAVGGRDPSIDPARQKARFLRKSIRIVDPPGSDFPRKPKPSRRLDRDGE